MVEIVFDGAKRGKAPGAAVNGFSLPDMAFSPLG